MRCCLNNLREKGELDRALYTANQWNRINDIMESPEYVFYWYYYKSNKKKSDDVRKELDTIKRSKSYRIGLIITFFPRKIQGGIRCYKDHGAGYTFRRTLYHLGLWEDEEAPKGPENRAKLVKHAERIFHPKKGK